MFTCHTIDDLSCVIVDCLSDTRGRTCFGSPLCPWFTDSSRNAQIGRFSVFAHLGEMLCALRPPLLQRGTALILVQPLDRLGLTGLARVYSHVAKANNGENFIYLCGASETAQAPRIHRAIPGGANVLMGSIHPALLSSLTRSIDSSAAPISRNPGRDESQSSLDLLDNLDVLIRRDAGPSGVLVRDNGLVVAPDATSQALSAAMSGRRSHPPRVIFCNQHPRDGQVEPDIAGFASWFHAAKHCFPDSRVVYQDVLRPDHPRHISGFKAAGLDEFRVELAAADLEPARHRSVIGLHRACLDSGVKVTVGGQLTDSSSSWQNVRAAWDVCDRLGLDMLQMLARTPIGAPNERAGWCGEVCQIMAADSNLFLQYRHVQATIMDMLCPSAQEPPANRSTITFLRHKAQQVRDLLLAELSRCGVRESELEQLRRSCAWAGSELHDVTKALEECDFRNPCAPTQFRKSASGQAETAVIVVAQDNPAHVNLCLNSLLFNTNRPYDLFVVDCSRREMRIEPISCRGQLFWDRLPLNRDKSFATAWGIHRARDYRYVLFVDSNACAIASDWLDGLISELNSSSECDVVGVHGGMLDYAKEESVLHLKNHVMSPSWRKELGLSGISDAELLSRLSVPGTSCFNELTGWIQLYRGDVLRRIALPIVDHPPLKNVHWDSELSMRAVACGAVLKNSEAAARSLHFFGARFDSGLGQLASYRGYVEQDARWLATNGHEFLAKFLIPAEYSPNLSKNAMTPLARG